MSSFSSLNLGARAIFAAQRGLDITGQNIANSATPGYSRQRVDQVAVGGPTVPAIWSKYDQTGGGVKVTGISRMRDEFLEARARTAHSALGQLEEQQKTYAAIERTIDEPSETGLKRQLADFWASWAKLSQDPHGQAGQVIVERGIGVANQLNHMSQQFQVQWADTRTELQANVFDVNKAAEDIAKLNRAIRNNVINGLPANELADQRDLLVEKVTTLTGGVAERDEDGVVNVKLGDSYLVNRQQFRTVKLDPPDAADSTKGFADYPAPGPAKLSVIWGTDFDGSAVTGTAVVGADTTLNAKSTMNGQLEALNTTLPKYLADLDGVASSLATLVNIKQAEGYTKAGAVGADLLTTASGHLAASTITFSADASALALSKGVPPAVIDGDNAKEMSALISSETGPDATFRSLVVDLGVQAQSVNRNQQVAANVVKTADDARESVSGVSLNEELTNLMQYQHSFEAAAKFITAVDATIESLLNMTR